MMLKKMETQGRWLFRYRGILPVIFLLFGAYFYLYTELHPESFFLEETPYEIYYEIGCLLISLLGFAVRVFTVGCTPAGTSGRNTKSGQRADKLNATGMYSIVRHPLYLGNFLIWLGIALLTGNAWFIIAFCMLFCIYYERIMFAEEQFLFNKFGQLYLDWATKTPAFFPNLKLWIKPGLQFSWKKILKNEKNGLLAIFLIFCLFDVLGEWIEGNDDYNIFLLVACMVSIAAFCVLLYLQKRTTLLSEAGR